jgi:hypothetical protein
MELMCSMIGSLDSRRLSRLVCRSVTALLSVAMNSRMKITISDAIRSVNDDAIWEECGHSFPLVALRRGGRQVPMHDRVAIQMKIETFLTDRRRAQHERPERRVEGAPNFVLARGAGFFAARRCADQVRTSYASLRPPVLVGLEATGSMWWFLHLLEELDIAYRV